MHVLHWILHEQCITLMHAMVVGGSAKQEAKECVKEGWTSEVGEYLIHGGVMNGKDSG